MKFIHLISSGKQVSKLLSLMAALFCFFVSVSYAQDTTLVQGKSTATIQLSFHKNADLSKTAIAKVMAVKNDKHIIATNAHLNFYIQNSAGPQLLKNACTDKKGMAIVDLPAELPLDAARHFTITAKIEKDSLYEDAEEHITNSEVTLTIQLQAADTAKLITAIVTETGVDGQKPVKDVEVKFYVQRLFGLLPLAEENTATTGEDGQATFIFPRDIPGDIAGNIVVVTRIEDNDNYGNVESKATAQWGVPIAVDKNPFPRALWEPYAPPTLIIVICVLFGGVWSAYSFMFYQLRRIKRDAKYQKQENYS